MQKFVSCIKTITRLSAVLVVLSLSPLAITAGSFASADDAPCIAPASTEPGVHTPTGSDADTFIYQCTGQYAGLYYNGYYTYSPATGVRSATFAPNYSYSCAAQKWTMDTYDYSPGQKTFVKNRVKASPTPNLPTNCPPPVVPTPATGTNSGSTPSAISNTGNGSQNSIDNSGTIDSTTTNGNTLSMGNTISSTANSGNAFILDNTSGGSANTGDASAQATIINLLQSSSNVLGSNTATFTANINGDVNGDFIFDPSATVSSTGNGSQNGIDNSLEVNTNSSNATDAQITNTIDISATSGDAKVAGNTTAGDATSGNATAIVNLMNLINSTVAAGQSFIGTININGNLNGDILLPQNFIDQLLAASGADSSNTAASSIAGSSNTTNSTTADINNAINSTATSGDAIVSGNTTAGDATSGNTKTGVTILNLTGSSVVGKNDLLVFVNVLGTWVGMIVNAPAGSTSASLGGGITSSGAASTNTTTNALSTGTTASNTNNFGITNDVTVAAASGNAKVKDNTTAGNATSGDANTAVNILNMTGSNLSLSNWFGVLFINVFGNWTGSFGMNTSAGNTTTGQNSASTTDKSQQRTAESATANDDGARQFASFVAHSATTDSSAGTTSSSPVPSSVLGASAKAAKIASATTTALPSPDNAAHASYALPLMGFIAAGIILVIGERGRIFSISKKK